MRRSFKLAAVIAAIAVFGIGVGLYAHSKKLPDSINLAVPFTSQAPTGNWANNENCEEAAITMANAYLTGDHEDKIPSAAANDAINNILAWEKANVGHTQNSGASDTVRMIKGIDHLTTKIISNYTADDLRKALAAGSPILLPVDGRLLHNPNFIAPGPIYHMVVLRGYNAQGFITNDPGTDQGENYIYTFDILKNAGADWDQGKTAINQSLKIAIVVSK